MIKAIICFIFGHKWTCNAEKKIPPTNEQLNSLAGYLDYAKMYCDRCGHESKLNKTL